MVRSLQGLPPPAAQNGLKELLRHQNNFLACLCYPKQDMVIRLNPHEETFTEALVIGKELLNSETLLLTVQCKQRMDYFAGQFVKLRREDGLIRSYSIANSHYHSNKLSFHIRRLAGGRFSAWVHEELAIGDILEISDPQGLCYYLPGTPDKAMLLIGTGSGLAPLAGIVNDALHHGHSGRIHLYHGSREMDGLYWIEEMRELAESHPNFHYIPCVSRGDAPVGVAKGRAYDVAMSELPSLRDWHVFLAGHPEMVAEGKRKAFLKGALIHEIFSEAFHLASATLD